MESYMRFKKVLDAKGLTPYKVSKNTGVASATLSEWKHGKVMPKSNSLLKIAQYLEVSVDYLIGTEVVQPTDPRLIIISKSEKLVDMALRLRKLNTRQLDIVNDLVEALIEKNSQS